MALLVSYLYQVQLRTHAVLLLELFLLNGLNERITDLNECCYMRKSASLPPYDPAGFMVFLKKLAQPKLHSAITWMTSLKGC
jgi:hypothetical protein